MERDSPLQGAIGEHTQADDVWFPPSVKGKVVPGHLEVSGGGLNHTYEVLQFHLHWGDTELHPGSEHMLNDRRYPMEVSLLHASR